ncbi:hypothetical protein Ndes2437A_g00043 [Nannochloris sp. 'desiccata']
MQDSLVCILEAGSLPVEEERVLASAGLTLRYGNTLGGPGCLLFSQDGTVAFLNAGACKQTPSFDAALVHSLSHLDNANLCIMPLGTHFPTHAMALARGFFQGVNQNPAWRSAQNDIVCSSKAGARILSALPLGGDYVCPGAASSNRILEESLHRGRMLRMELGSLAALSRATAVQLQAAAGISAQAAENLKNFFVSKPPSTVT